MSEFLSHKMLDSYAVHRIISDRGLDTNFPKSALQNA